MEPLTGKTIKGYVLGEMIGEGGFGAVYRAEQPVIARTVAVKVIWPVLANNVDFIRRFESEARIIASLEHPQIVPIYDFWRDPEGAYLVMRWLRGGNLRSTMHEPWDPETVSNFLSQIAGAIALAHRYGVVHQDIKPENILLDEERNAYLSDFGVARIFGDSDKEGPANQGGSVLYAAPEQFDTTPTTPQTDQYSLAIITYELLTGESPFAGLAKLSVKDLTQARQANDLPQITMLRPDVPQALDAVLARATATDPRKRYPDTVAFAQAFRQALTFKANQQAEAIFLEDPTLHRTPGGTIQTPQGTRLVDHILSDERLIEEQPNPYKGLRPFKEGDSAYFFGRETLTEHLINRLAETNPPDLTRFLAVVGPSGSGKSSLVNAGLIPALRRGDLPGADKWFIVEITPGTHPLEEIEVALLRVATQPKLDLHEHLARDARGLARAINLALPDDGSQLLLVIDQFEELFTLVEDTRSVQFVLDSLSSALTMPNSRFRLIITLRADFYDRPLMYETFSRLVRQRTEVVVPMTSEELERAIVGPLLHTGVWFERGLVSTIVSDISGQLGALPLLQYGLTELFERREGQYITFEAYREIGGILGALARRAETVYLSLPPEQQEATRQLFLRLVTLGEGTEDTRRRILLSEATAITGDAETIKRVVDVFSWSRLLTFDRDPVTRSPTLEVAHEAILREWTRLRNWLDQSRNDVRLHRVLANLAEEWSANNRDQSFLLRGSRLEQYEEWHRESSLMLTQTEADYLDSSIADREARRAEEAERLRHEQMLEARAQVRLRLLLVVMAFATVIAWGLASFAFSERNEAEQARATSEANAELSDAMALVANARAALASRHLDLALALALEANRRDSAPPEARQLLIDLGLGPGVRRAFNEHSVAVRGIDFNSDGTHFVSSAETVIVWDWASGDPLHRLREHEGRVDAVAFSPDDRLIASASFDGRVILWDAETGEMVREFVKQAGQMKAVAFSPDGQYLASGDDASQLILWDTETGEIIEQFETGAPILTVAFSPDGHQLLSGGEDKRLVLWDIATGEIVQRFRGHTGWVRHGVFSPDGSVVLSGAEDGQILMWDAATGEQLLNFQGHTRVVYDIVFSPDGRTVVSSSADASLIHWDANAGTPIRSFRAANGVPYGLTFSPDGRRVLAGYIDGQIREWDLSSVGEVWQTAFPGVGLVRTICSPDGQSALTATGPTDVDNLQFGNVELVQVDTDAGQIIQRLRGHILPITSIVFRDDGRTALTGSLDGTIILWNLETGKVIRRFQGHQGFIYSVALSPDGSRLISGSADRTVRVWDIVTGEVLMSFTGHTRPIVSVAFHPEGQMALSGGDDGTLLLWDTESGEIVHTLEGHTGIVFSIDFTADGQRAVTGALDTNIILWDVETGTAIQTLQGHSGAVTTVDFSPDDHLLLSGSEDKMVILWDVETGTAVRVYEGHIDAVSGVDFGPEGLTALSASLDGTLRLWQIVPYDLTGDSLNAFVTENRYIYPLSCEEQKFYHIVDSCP